MNIKNENRIGYKKTKAGWIPEEWSVSALGQGKHFITSGSRGWSQYYSDSGALFVRITNLSRDNIDLDNTDCRYVALPRIGSEGVRTRLQEGDVLISITADLGIIGYFASSAAYSNAYVNQHIALLRLLDQNVYSKFVAYQLSGKQAQKRFCRITDQGAKAGLNLSAIRSFPIPLPPLPEQEAIAGVLECWDRGIKNLELRIEKKRNIKKGLMQKLLSGQIRLPGFSPARSELGIENRECRIPEGWKEVRLGEIVSATYGKNWKGVASKNGDYTVYGTGGAMGQSSEFLFKAPAILLGRKGTIDAPIYIDEPFWAVDTTFAIHGIVNVDLVFLYNKFLTIPWRQYNEASGVPSLSRTTILRIKVTLPPFEEQQAIASVLSAADSEIEVLERKLALLKDQKRFLLNNLVTGSLRLPKFATTE